ncbi:hypothetical protein CBM2626_U50002 [Cupriavidus taiwanensis]|nr:hypothetical protein CBM2626_U50002 [Cupriavidus taiwanensis]
MTSGGAMTLIERLSAATGTSRLALQLLIMIACGILRIGNGYLASGSVTPIPPFLQWIPISTPLTKENYRERTSRITGKDEETVRR